MDMQYKTSETGMYLDDVFMLLADYEISRAQRYPSPVSLLHISLNLDQAKPAQSKSIKQHFAGNLNSSLRISDIPAHYGNDFLILMPATDENGAQTVSRRLISRLRGTSNFADGNEFKFVIHVGITTHPGGENISVARLLKQAKAALQKAKKAGPHTYKQFSEK